MDETLDTLKCYKILEVPPGAKPERVRQAYIELARTWDPEKHIDNPILRAETQKKRKEIDDAYKALCVFLPDLQKAHDAHAESDRPVRDFTEMERETPIESTRAVLGFIVALVFLLIFAWAFYLVMKGRALTPVPTPLE